MNMVQQLVQVQTAICFPCTAQDTSKHMLWRLQQCRWQCLTYLWQLLTHNSIKLPFTDTVPVDNDLLRPLLGVAVELLQQLLDHTLEVLQHQT